MIPADVLLFSLVFPSVAAFAGVYLIYRGASRFTKSGKSVICGTVKCKKTLKSFATGRDCVFFYTLIESYKRGAWRPVYFIKNGVSFMLGGRTVEEGITYLKLSKPIVIHGAIPHRKGLIEKGSDMVRDNTIYRAAAAPVLGRFGFFAPSAYLPLDASVLKRLQGYPALKKILEHDNIRIIRITEHVLGEGMEICAIAEAETGGKEPIKGTVEFPLIISDMKPDDAVESLKERSWLSILAGAAIMMISALLLISLLTQL